MLKRLIEDQDGINQSFQLQKEQQESMNSITEKNLNELRELVDKVSKTLTARMDEMKADLSGLQHNCETRDASSRNKLIEGGLLESKKGRRKNKMRRERRQRLT